MANPTDFLLNTDYELDKIVYFKEGSFTQREIIQHKLNFTPLIFGVWSSDKDFNSVNTLGEVYNPYLTPETPIMVSARVKGDDINSPQESEIWLQATGKDSGSTEIYYRIYAFAPPEYKGSTPLTASKARQFILNTDYNYRKLKKAGIFYQNGDEYAHNLGYLPHIMAWQLFKYQEGDDFELYPFTYAPIDVISIEITDVKIKFHLDKSYFQQPLNKVYWRLYYDEG